MSSSISTPTPLPKSIKLEPSDPVLAEIAVVQERKSSAFWDDDGDVAMGPTVAELSEDDGYVSPEFDLPSASDEEESEDERPPAKKARKAALSTLQEEEELALQMLRSRR